MPLATVPRATRMPLLQAPRQDARAEIAVPVGSLGRREAHPRDSGVAGWSRGVAEGDDDGLGVHE